MAHYFSPSHELSALRAVRGCMDGLVQGSLVELFAAYGVAVAPLPRMVGSMVSDLPEVSVAIGFTCHAQDCGAGRLTLSVPSTLLDQMKGEETPSIKLDWARELANQLVGRIKNRLLPFATRLDVGNASMIERSQLQERLQRLRDIRVYSGRTLRGTVLVTLEGLPSDAALKYVGPVTAAEGDVLWL